MKAREGGEMYVIYRRSIRGASFYSHLNAAASHRVSRLSAISRSSGVTLRLARRRL